MPEGNLRGIGWMPNTAFCVNFQMSWRFKRSVIPWEGKLWNVFCRPQIWVCKIQNVKTSCKSVLYIPAAWEGQEGHTAWHAEIYHWKSFAWLISLVVFGRITLICFVADDFFADNFGRKVTNCALLQKWKQLMQQTRKFIFHKVTKSQSKTEKEICLRARVLFDLES